MITNKVASLPSMDYHITIMNGKLFFCFKNKAKGLSFFKSSLNYMDDALSY